MSVSEDRMKSSADSISAWWEADGREAVAMRPSGRPVLKAKAVGTSRASSCSTRGRDGDRRALTLLLRDFRQFKRNIRDFLQGMDVAPPPVPCRVQGTNPGARDGRPALEQLPGGVGKPSAEKCGANH